MVSFGVVVFFLAMICCCFTRQVSACGMCCVAMLRFDLWGLCARVVGLCDVLRMGAENPIQNDVRVVGL